MWLSLLFSLAFAQDSKGLKCPMGIGSLEGDSPKITNQYQPGKYLFVCGFNEDEVRESSVDPAIPLIMTGFEIYSWNEGASQPVRIKTVATLEKHELERTDDGLIISDFVKIGKTEQSTFKTVVKCRDGSCQIDKPSCLFRRLKNVSAIHFRDFKQYCNGTKKDKVPNEKTVEGAAQFALSGDPEAIGLFFRNPAPVRLEGGTKEIFHRYSDLIKRLRDHRCL